MIARLRALCAREDFGRLLRFGVIGGLTALLYAALFFALVEGAGLARFAASTAAYLGAIVFQYFGHSLFTFRTPAVQAGQVWRFCMTNLTGCVLAALVTEVLPRIAPVPVWIAVGLVIFGLPVFNWLVMGRWVFKGRA